MMAFLQVLGREPIFIRPALTDDMCESGCDQMQPQDCFGLGRTITEEAPAQHESYHGLRPTA